MEDRIYTMVKNAPDSSVHLVALDLDGTLIAKSPIAYPYDTEAYVLNGVSYMLESRGYREDCLLHRLTPDLQPNGEVPVPYMTSLDCSPDGTELYAAGFEAGLRIIDADSLQVVHELRQKSCCPVKDGKGRFWLCDSSYFECYTPELKCVSRHRLKGEVCLVYRNNSGQACAVTYQRSKYIIRVYRFS